MKTIKLLTAVLAGFFFVAAVTVAQVQGDSAKKQAPLKSSIQVPEDKDRPKPTTEKEKKAEEKAPPVAGQDHPGRSQGGWNGRLRSHL